VPVQYALGVQPGQDRDDRRVGELFVAGGQAVPDVAGGQCLRAVLLRAVLLHDGLLQDGQHGGFQLAGRPPPRVFLHSLQCAT